MGMKLSVSRARYSKEDRLSSHKMHPVDHPSSKRRWIKNPAFRNSRKYSEVLRGKKLVREEEMKENNTIPVFFSLNVSENNMMVEQLKHAIIAESVDVLDLAKTSSWVAASKVPVVCMYSLSLTKVLLVFESVDDVDNVVKDESILWEFFEDIRRWTEDEFYADKLVWLECYGIHPKCWSLDIIRKIGEKWGPILSIDEKVNCIDSRTYARFLVRTKAQNKINVRIRLLFENGSCDVWVKECGPCVCNYCCTTSCKSCDLANSALGNNDKLETDSRQWVSETLEVSGDFLIHENHSKGHIDQNPCVLIDPLVSDIAHRSIVEMNVVRYDPIESNELSRYGVDCSGMSKAVRNGDLGLEPHDTPCFQSNGDLQVIREASMVGIQGKRPRGRPKKLILSQCDTQSVSQVPLKSVIKAKATWNTAKLLGIKASNEEAVIAELRKSKRLMVMEEQNPTLG